MKTKGLSALLLTLGLTLAVETASLDAQTTAKTLTLLYSNNVNGEFDPCPT